jgi:chemotaxis response regulator CheB
MGSKIRVLLADDHTVLREATAELVDHQPDMVVVGQAGTGEETVRLSRQLRPDVVVMDIAMPRGNGLEAARHIVSELPDFRVLVLTAHEDRDHVILFQLLMVATVANLTLVANKTEQRGLEGSPSLSLSLGILAFSKSIWNHLSHLELNLTSFGGQKHAFRLGF